MNGLFMKASDRLAGCIAAGGRNRDDGDSEAKYVACFIRHLAAAEGCAAEMGRRLPAAAAKHPARADLGDKGSTPPASLF